jgi:hypothetical protein
MFAFGVMLLALVPTAVAAHPYVAAQVAATDGPRAAVGNSSPGASGNLSNTSARLNGTIGSFAAWFVHGLGTVIALVFGVLLVGGIVNYVLVGRKRGEWTPAAAGGAGTPGQPPDVPRSGGPPPGVSPP